VRSQGQIASLMQVKAVSGALGCIFDQVRNRGLKSVDNRQHFSLWYFVLVVLFILSLQSVLFNQRVESLAYSDFQSLLHAGKVKEVLIGEDSLSGTVDLRGAETLLPAQAAKCAGLRAADDHPLWHE
jgi:FtsH Extracellular